MDAGGNYFVITGGPGSGKTTLVEALRAMGNEAVDEAGRAIIRQQKAIGGAGTHDGDRVLFRELMLTRMIDDHERMAEHEGPVFFDRSIPGLIGYCRLVGVPVADHVRAAAARYRYNEIVFATPPWPEIYANDAERRQDFGEAVRTFEAVVEGCREAGYRVVEVPAFSVAERAAFVLGTVNAAG